MRFEICLTFLVSLGLGKDKNDPQLDVYKNDFESVFLQVTETYYTVEASEISFTLSVGEYMKRVEERLNQEQKRLRTYLHMSTESELNSRVERVFIAEHKDLFWDAIPNLLHGDKLAVRFSEFMKSYFVLGHCENVLTFGTCSRYRPFERPF